MRESFIPPSGGVARLIAHGEPIRRPPESSTLDYEAELAVVIGRGGGRIQGHRALEQGRLNGRVMQDSRTDLLIFSVPTLSNPVQDA